MDNRLYWIWLSLSCTVGSTNFIRLIEHFGSPSAIFEATDAEIAAVIGSSSSDYRALTDKNLDRANEILNFCISKNVGIVTYEDEKFPSSLKNIKNPPVLLYYRGVLPDFENQFFISVVGTRRLSTYGKTNTYNVSYDVAKAGATIVSGMAHGIDGVALAAALAAGQSTVAILGSGIDVCYPREHRRLAQEIVKKGCVMTEYAPGTPPERHNFPKRNRLISAISVATIVMEGTEKSGSLITARCAFEQGKIVYALPGNVGNDKSEATNLLIMNGAKLFITADDIVRDFDRSHPGKLNPFSLKREQRADMAQTLASLMVSCVCTDDPVFRPAKRKATAQKSQPRPVNEPINDSKTESTNAPASDESAALALTPETLSLYKKIPTRGDCSIESLVDEKHNLREVMNGLLTLGISGFVTTIPGERVRRKLN